MHFSYKNTNERSMINCFLSSFIILCTFTLPWSSAAGTSLAQEFDHFAWLDVNENYGLYWSALHANKSIHFAVSVKTTGWVGFGFSKGLSGNMVGADLVIGWVSGGKGYLEDRYATKNGRPIKDPHQDYVLTGSSEQNGTTILKFKRKLFTCDSHDNNITEGTTKVIWAFHPDDPKLGNENSIKFHKHNRGSRSINLLSYKKSTPLPKNTKYFDIVNNEVNVPSRDTTYWCQAFKIPNLVNVTKKAYVIEIAPVIQTRDEGLVHHIVIYGCSPNFNESHLNATGHCYGDMPSSIGDCVGLSAIYAWAIGGGNFKLPSHVGIPFGTNDTMKYVVMETHFDNPSKSSGFKDISGLRFYYTEKKVKYEAATLTQGVAVTARQLIPPGQPSWMSTGYCPKECSKYIKTTNALNGNTIKIFASFPHAHTAGIAIWTKLFRNETEIKEIIRDSNYDFNNQQTHMLEKEIAVKAGDEMITYCRYNTKNRTEGTKGGFSTRDEMCINFLLYYPRIDFTKCGSIEYWNYYFIKKYAKKIPGPYGNMVNTWAGVKWNQSMVDELKYYEKKSPIMESCLGLFGKKLGKGYQVLNKTNTYKFLPAPKDNCPIAPVTITPVTTPKGKPGSDATYIHPVNVVLGSLLLCVTSIIVQWY